MLFCIEDDTHRVTVMKVDNPKTIKKEKTIEKRDYYTEAENDFKEIIVFKDIIPDTDFEYPKHWLVHPAAKLSVAVPGLWPA